MKMKIKNKSHRYDISRSTSRHGHNYDKCKKVPQYSDAYLY